MVIFVPSAQQFVLPFPASWDLIETGSQNLSNASKLQWLHVSKLFTTWWLMNQFTLNNSWWHFGIGSWTRIKILLSFHIMWKYCHDMSKNCMRNSHRLNCISYQNMGVRYFTKMYRDEMTEDISEIFPMLWLRAISLSYYILPHHQNTRPLEVRA